MNIEREITKFKEPIGFGCERKAFYSKKYDVVIKLPLSLNHQTQSRREQEIFDILTEEERELFPVVKFVETSRGLAIVMKKVSIISDLLDSIRDWNLQKEIRDVIDIIRYSNVIEDTNLNLLKEIGVKDTSSFEKLFNFKVKYDLSDFHFSNIGVLDGKLVAIDLGLRQGDRISEDSGYNINSPYTNWSDTHDSTTKGSF